MSRFISREAAVKKTPARLALRKRKRVVVPRFQQNYDETDEEEEDEVFHTKRVGSGDRHRRGRGVELDPISVVEKKSKVVKATRTGHPTPPVSTVQKALSEGSTYRVKDITEVQTTFGTKQVWTMESKLSKQGSRIWAPRVLTQLTHIDPDTPEVVPRRVNILKCVDITYKGFTVGPGNKPRYNFAITEP